MADIREAQLPGLGRKYEIGCASGDRLVVVIHDDGRRELYHFSKDQDEPVSSVTLSDQEARQIGSIIEGAFYQPKALEVLDVDLPGLRIEWEKMPAGSPLVGRSIDETAFRARTGASIIAIVPARGGEALISPAPETMLEQDDTLVLAGKPEQIKKAVTIIQGKER